MLFDLFYFFSIHFNEYRTSVSTILGDLLLNSNFQKREFIDGRCPIRNSWNGRNECGNDYYLSSLDWESWPKNFDADRARNYVDLHYMSTHLLGGFGMNSKLILFSEFTYRTKKNYELKLVKSIFWKCLNVYIFQSPVASYLSIVFVIMFVVGFATGPGSIPWFFVNELFQQSARPMAASMAVVTNWTANFLVGLCFLPMQVSKA